MRHGDRLRQEPPLDVRPIGPPGCATGRIPTADGSEWSKRLTPAPSSRTPPPASGGAPSGVQRPRASAFPSRALCPTVGPPGLWHPACNGVIPSQHRGVLTQRRDETKKPSEHPARHTSGRVPNTSDSGSRREAPQHRTTPSVRCARPGSRHGCLASVPVSPHGRAVAVFPHSSHPGCSAEAGLASWRTRPVSASPRSSTSPSATSLQRRHGPGSPRMRDLDKAPSVRRDRTPRRSGGRRSETSPRRFAIVLPLGHTRAGGGVFGASRPSPGRRPPSRPELPPAALASAAGAPSSTRAPRIP